MLPPFWLDMPKSNSAPAAATTARPEKANGRMLPLAIGPSASRMPHIRTAPPACKNPKKCHRPKKKPLGVRPPCDFASLCGCGKSACSGEWWMTTCCTRTPFSDWRPADGQHYDFIVTPECYMKYLPIWLSWQTVQRSCGKHMCVHETYTGFG